jgi:hypothetical protein
LLHSPLQIFEAPIFYPEKHTLAYSEHLILPAIMGAPLSWAGVSPVIVHNVLFILGLALSGWAMCLVMVEWTGLWSAAIVAGVAYAFNAHVLARFTHLQAQHVEFFPFVLLAIDRVPRSPFDFAQGRPRARRGPADRDVRAPVALFELPARIHRRRDGGRRDCASAAAADA